MASHAEDCPSYGNTIQQPGCSTKSAMNRVLDTPEILEMILARMDMRTLLTSAQQVCHQWVNLITQSPSIQKALFFTPIKDSEWGREEAIHNPLLAEAFPSFFPAKNRPKYYKFDFSELIMIKDDSTMALFLRKDASWRKMLVQQPPISDIGIFRLYHSMGGDYTNISSLSADKKMQESGYDGIRMERLFELLLTVFFSDFSGGQVYWSTEEPISFDGSYKKNICDDFHRIISKFGLVLYTRTTVQCTGDYGPLNTAELKKKKIITAYREHGLDLDGIEKDIPESEG